MRVAFQQNRRKGRIQIPIFGSTIGQWKKRYLGSSHTKNPVAESDQPTTLNGPKQVKYADCDALGRSNRRREHPVRLMLLWLIPMSAAIMAFSTPFWGAKAYDYVMSTGYFVVREVVVEGMNRLSEAEVLELAGIGAGTHVLASDLDAMERRIERHMYVAKANVERELPGRLILTIHEHFPVAYLTGRELMVVNSSGEPFATPAPEADHHMPIISGVAWDTFREDSTEERKSVARADIRAAINLSRLYSQMGLSNRWPIGEIRIEKQRNLTLVLSESGTEVVLGVSPYRKKLYRLEWILEKLHQNGKAAEYVLLDGFGSAFTGHDDGRVVVRADVALSDAEITAKALQRADEAERAQKERMSADESRTPGEPRDCKTDEGRECAKAEFQAASATEENKKQSTAPSEPRKHMVVMEHDKSLLGDVLSGAHLRQENAVIRNDGVGNNQGNN